MILSLPLWRLSFFDIDIPPPISSTRVKQASRGKHEWASLPVPTSKDNLLVTGLLAATNYQFSVLPQNKLGSGPFSVIVSVRTQGWYYNSTRLTVFSLPLCLFYFTSDHIRVLFNSAANRSTPDGPHSANAGPSHIPFGQPDGSGGSAAVVSPRVSILPFDRLRAAGPPGPGPVGHTQQWCGSQPERHASTRPAQG